MCALMRTIPPNQGGISPGARCLKEKSPAVRQGYLYKVVLLAITLRFPELSAQFAPNNPSKPNQPGTQKSEGAWLRRHNRVATDSAYARANKLNASAAVTCQVADVSHGPGAANDGTTGKSTREQCGSPRGRNGK